MSLYSEILLRYTLTFIVWI